MNLATCISYSGHTVYSDGRLYRNYELIGEYATEAAAKAQATRRYKAELKAWSRDHHAELRRFWAATA